MYKALRIDHNTDVIDVTSGRAKCHHITRLESASLHSDTDAGDVARCAWQCDSDCGKARCDKS